MPCRFAFIPDDSAPVYRGLPGDAHRTALLFFGIDPDAAPVLHRGRTLSQEKKIEAGEVGKMPASSRG